MACTKHAWYPYQHTQPIYKVVLLKCIFINPLANWLVWQRLSYNSTLCIIATHRMSLSHPLPVYPCLPLFLLYYIYISSLVSCRLHICLLLCHNALGGYYRAFNGIVVPGIYSVQGIRCCYFLGPVYPMQLFPQSNGIHYSYLLGPEYWLQLFTRSRVSAAAISSV